MSQNINYTQRFEENNNITLTSDDYKSYLYIIRNILHNPNSIIFPAIYIVLLLNFYKDTLAQLPSEKKGLLL